MQQYKLVETEIKVPKNIQVYKALCSSISGPMGVLTGKGQDNYSSLGGSLSETRLSCLLSAVDFLLSAF